MRASLARPASCGNAGCTSSSSSSRAATVSTSVARVYNPLRLLPKRRISIASPPRATPDEDLEAQMEAFLKKQAEIEGSGSVGATATATVEQVADATDGGAKAGPGGDQGAVLGADVVSDDVSAVARVVGFERAMRFGAESRAVDAVLSFRDRRTKNSTSSFSSHRRYLPKS